VLRVSLLGKLRRRRGASYHVQLQAPSASNIPNPARRNWSNRALENRHIWKGDAYVSRVYALHKMRTNASLKSWEMAGEHFATTPTTEAQRAEELARIETKTYAREWIDYSAKAGRDAAPAVHLCLSASGDKGFCATN
jgi:hypothetical protein